MPLARANEVILKEEEGHEWFVASMRIFGRAGTPGNHYCLRVGLKTRDSGGVAAAYVDSIRPVMVRCGLRFPEPERAAARAAAPGRPERACAGVA